MSVRSVIGSLRLTCRIGMVRLLCVDGVLWRAEDSKDNAEAFAKPTNKDGQETQYPQLHMVCQMELSSHLITGSAFDCYTVNEMKLAWQLIETTPQ